MQQSPQQHQFFSVIITLEDDARELHAVLLALAWPQLATGYIMPKCPQEVYLLRRNVHMAANGKSRMQ